MPELKLAKLPDRMPVKMTITVQPDLAHALREYAAYPNSGHVSPAEKSRPCADSRHVRAGETHFAEITS